jgi:hypothetical protein
VQGGRGSKKGMMTIRLMMMLLLLEEGILIEIVDH